MTYYLGIDIGTSSIKVVLLDAEQHEHGVASRPLSVSRPAPGWSCLVYTSDAADDSTNV